MLTQGASFCSGWPPPAVSAGVRLLAVLPSASQADEYTLNGSPSLLPKCPRRRHAPVSGRRRGRRLLRLTVEAPEGPSRRSAFRLGAPGWGYLPSDVSPEETAERIETEARAESQPKAAQPFESGDSLQTFASGSDCRPGPLSSRRPQATLAGGRCTLGGASSCQSADAPLLLRSVTPAGVNAPSRCDHF